MKTFLLLALSACMVGCSLPSAPTPEDISGVAQNLTYFRDQRTGLCFASVNFTTYSNYKVASISAVPCDKVERFIKP